MFNSAMSRRAQHPAPDICYSTHHGRWFPDKHSSSMQHFIAIRVSRQLCTGTECQCRNASARTGAPLKGQGSGLSRGPSDEIKSAQASQAGTAALCSRNATIRYRQWIASLQGCNGHKQWAICLSHSLQSRATATRMPLILNAAWQHVPPVQPVWCHTAAPGLMPMEGS
jgi:hypothetical protein